MTNAKEMVVSLRRGFSMRDLDPTGSLTLAQYVSQIMNAKNVEGFPTGTTAVVNLNDREFEKLRSLIGAKCHIVPRSRGRVDI